MRLYATSKRHRPQITSITLLEYKNGHVTTEEQISHSPLAKNPQRYVSPLGFEVEIDINVSDGKVRLTTSKDINDRTTFTPPPLKRSAPSFPFKDHQFTEWCVRKPP
ncbi:2107_t:CDS:2, partial [Racocetra fulgida]